jgi:hypothetical protein
MNAATTTVEGYGGQLSRWVAAFAAGRYQDFEGELEATCTPHDVKRFLVNSFGNRYSWLIREAASLGCVFADLPALVREYIHAVPRAPYDITAPSDEERFLIWLIQTQTLTPIQFDFITCQRSEFAVGTEARRNRPAHLRFQELCKHGGERVAQFGAAAKLRAQLNPIRFAGQLLTSVLAPGVESLPISILFYAAGTRVRAILLEGVTAEAVHKLMDRGPCTLEEWAADEYRPDTSPTELLRLTGELAAQGLVAFA